MQSGFYLVRLNGREFEVCVHRDVPVFARADDSQPIPWVQLSNYEGEWQAGRVVAYSRQPVVLDVFRPVIQVDPSMAPNVAILKAKNGSTCVLRQVEETKGR